MLLSRVQRFTHGRRGEVRARVFRGPCDAHHARSRHARARIEAYVLSLRIILLNYRSLMHQFSSACSSPDIDLRMLASHGNFLVRSTDLLVMPAVPQDQSYAIEV